MKFRRQDGNSPIVADWLNSLGVQERIVLDSEELAIECLKSDRETRVLAAIESLRLYWGVTTASIDSLASVVNMAVNSEEIRAAAVAAIGDPYFSGDEAARMYIHDTLYRIEQMAIFRGESDLAEAVWTIRQILLAVTYAD